MYPRQYLNQWLEMEASLLDRAMLFGGCDSLMTLSSRVEKLSSALRKLEIEDEPVKKAIDELDNTNTDLIFFCENIFSADGFRIQETFEQAKKKAVNAVKECTSSNSTL